MRINRSLIFSAICAALVLASCGQNKKAAKSAEPQEATSSETAVSEADSLDAIYTANSLKPGEAAPDFTLKTPSGDKTYSLSESKGKYVVLDFWASWCPDCQKVASDLVRLSNEYSEKGVDFIGISFDDDAEAWKKALAEQGDSKIIPVSELKKWKETEISKAYHIEWIPTFYVLDKEGKVLLVTVDAGKLESCLKSLN